MSEAAGDVDGELAARIGTVLADRYRLDSLIGKGGMGAVYRAHHLLLKRDVAVKVLHPALSANPDVSKRFDREAQSAARLEHPNIIHVTEFGSTDDGTKYMVMQLLEGQELVSVLGAPVGEERALELVLQILTGLEHAHKHGVIHRDLKPENVFVTQNHEGRELLKLVDFGIAKMFGSDSDDEEGDGEPLTKLGLVFGTPQYMSPEQATGLAIDARTDVYSAGIILYELLKGEPPFWSEDPVSLIRMQVGATLPPLPDYISPALREVVDRMLAKDRDERFTSAAAARAALLDIHDQIVSGVWEPISDPGSDPGSGSASAPEAKQTAPTRPARGEPSTSAKPVAVPPPAEHSTIPWIVGGLAAVAGLVAVFAILAQDGKTKTGTETPVVQEPSPTAEGDEPPDATLAEIDRLLLAKNAEEALSVLASLRVGYPDSAGLVWREGQALTLQGRKMAGPSLARYGQALELDPTLVEDHGFYAELHALLGKKKLRDPAIEIALTKMGKQGHKFLLELINTENAKEALDYNQRKRVIAVLESEAESASLVNVKLNLARDIWQAHQSPTPCKSFSDALEQIAAAPDEAFHATVMEVKIPALDAEIENVAEKMICDQIPPRLLAVQTDLEERFGGTATEGAPEPDRG